MRRLILALLLLLAAHPAQAQTSCSVLSQSQLLSSFSDTAPTGSITPRNMRDFVCSSALLSASGTGVSGHGAMFLNSGSGITIQDAAQSIVAFPQGINTTTSSAVPTGVVYTSLNNSQYGALSCSQQMYLIFAHVRGFYALNGACATNAISPAGDQFIQGLFSVVDQGGAASSIPLVAQGIAQVSNVAEYGINTVHLDSATAGESSAASISGTTLTVGGTTYGAFAVGDWIYGAGVTPGTTITALGTGAGGAGTYTVSNSQTVSSEVMTDHPVYSNVILQDEMDFFSYQSDTASRFLIDGFFANGPASVANKRSGVLVGLFSGSNGTWQNGFFSGNGCCDVGVKIGDTAITQVASLLSQQLGFNYTDNTNNTNRDVILTADPTLAGSTGADLTVTSSYGGAANLSVVSGSLKVGGKNVANSSGSAVHQVLFAHAEGVTGNATTCMGITGVATAVACSAPAGNTVQVQGNQNGQISNFLAHVTTAPGIGNSYVVNVLGNSAIVLTCTISDANTSCSPSGTTTVAITSNSKMAYQVVASASAPTAQMTFAISFDNPAP